MPFLKDILPGAKKRRAKKLANTVRDMIVGQRTGVVLYGGANKDYGAQLSPEAVLAISAAAANEGQDDKNEKQPSTSEVKATTNDDQTPISTSPTPGNNKPNKVRKKHKQNRQSQSQHSRRHHRKHRKQRKRRAREHQKALQQLQQPDTLSVVLDILRVMPNPFKTQSLMQQMFQHDWRSMSMPDLPLARMGLENNQNGRLEEDGDNDLGLPPDEAEAFVFWWGYEIYLPQKTLQKLMDGGDVATGILYFLGTLSKTVPAIYPFVNIIATYAAMQFSIIKAADNGNGIVLVATWVLPVMLVPKPWEDRFRDNLQDRVPVNI